ncbi:MAG TPA: NAD-dependent epimerase/dehydratase family protein [Chthoniobacterales bacterium]|nr:NAD-dependent epimerase/dehydratase family protein [Chthoniobacterales bacterium]
MKALVTGANGLIGTHVVRALLTDEHDVRAFVRPKSDRRSLEGVEVEFAHGDILQPKTIADAAAGCDVIFHTAAVFAYTGYTADQLLSIALDGTRNLLLAARDAGVQRVVLTSSSVVLGSSTQPEVRNEGHELNERILSQYVRAKVAQERDAFNRARSLGLELVAVLPTITVGPHDMRLGPSNAIICSYLQDPWKLTWPGGCNIVAAEDVAKGHLLAALRGRAGARYLLGSENLEWPRIHRLISQISGVGGPMFQANHTSAFLAATAQELFSWATRTKPLTTRTQAAMVGRFYWYDHARAARELGYAPMSAPDALYRAIEWLSHTAHIPPWVRAILRVRPFPVAAAA